MVNNHSERTNVHSKVYWTHRDRTITRGSHTLGTSDEQKSDTTIIIIGTSVGVVALAVIACLMGAGLLITLRRKCRLKHKSTEAVQERILLSDARYSTGIISSCLVLVFQLFPSIVSVLSTI